MNSHGENYTSHSSWSYGGTGASIWKTNGPLSMHTATAPTHGASLPSAPASSSFLSDDIYWRSWPNTNTSVTATTTAIENNSLRAILHRRSDNDIDDEGQLPLPAPAYQPSELDSNTLCMSNLEPWMDHEYASQVVRLMGWDRNATVSNNHNTNQHDIQNPPVTVKIPPLTPDTIPPHNNPGYCLISFPTAAHAASVLASLNSSNSKDTSGAPLLMPNSTKPFNLQWASPAQLSQAFSLPFSSPSSNSLVTNLSLTNNTPTSSQGHQQKEYSIFVGDLAPETSNSDLVAVFRNPVLGLRNDREPKFIRPFYSCKSAKIMLDPVTGISRGYGFVRFTDEADQQRALIEMHGLYCLSRPMRVSPATAKFKSEAHPNGAGGGQPSQQLEKPKANINSALSESSESSSVKPPPLVRSVSSPVAVQTNSSSSTCTNTDPATTASRNGKSNGSNSPDKSSATTPTPEQSQSVQITPQILAQIRELAAEGPRQPPAKEWDLAHIQQMVSLGNLANSSSPSYPTTVGNASYNNGVHGNGLLDEAWNHQAQARAILSNLIGPNGEQLTSTDPYNTTVFVGGLSPLISEETLRTFFAPFGDIHYVKVPLGKHCGFVQFVRKSDAERAIDRMQGFPIGGSRIRLSWGRSQYKAAQAAAQAAQQAQAEHAARLAAALTSGQNQPMLQLTREQAIQLLYSLGYNAQPVTPSSNDSQSTQQQFQQFQHLTNQQQSIPTIPNGNGSSTELSQSNLVSGPSSSTLSVSLPRGYAYSQGFNGGLLPSGQDASSSDPPSLSPSGSTTSRLTSLGSINGGLHSSSYTVAEASSTFQASDILREGSHSPFARLTPQQQASQSELSPSPSSSSSLAMRRTPPRMQAHHQQQRQQHQQQQHQQRVPMQTNHLKLRDDMGNGANYASDLESSLANLDLSERYSSRIILGNGNGNGKGSDAVVNNHFRERRPLSNSISAPLNNLVVGTELGSETL